MTPVTPPASPPKSTGRPPVSIDLTGKLFAWSKAQPVLLSMPGSEHLYLACFSSVEALRALHARVAVPFDSIKQVEVGSEFLESVYDDVVVILDPYFTPEGRVRFFQVTRAGS